jgi:IS4 transposase
MIDWYRRRWLIEIFFRILKSGCRVESLQLSNVDRLERAIMIYLIIGWRILHIVTTGQASPNLPCDVVFDPYASS